MPGTLETTIQLIDIYKGLTQSSNITNKRSANLF